MFSVQDVFRKEVAKMDRVDFVVIFGTKRNNDNTWPRHVYVSERIGRHFQLGHQPALTSSSHVGNSRSTYCLFLHAWSFVGVL